MGKSDGRNVSEPAGPARPAGGSGATVLGAGTRFVGELFGDEDIVVNGRFHGTLRVDRRVTIGPDGDVEGEIYARQVIVGGRVKGDVHAAERAELTSSGAVEGSVHAPKVVIAEGARLEGSVAMSGEKAAPASGESLPETGEKGASPAPTPSN
ncbi:MAG: polymer-forming cytoskeletal protein [Acidobacteria bacterium]|nr:polymer-forming cytoskeletal protein [Acidobacteriota bacterium]MCA1609853.1 polymer-forming cytoskeletal protein [Acidobacteriota bacterium]